MINLLSVVNMKPCMASVAIIGLFNEGSKACVHEEIGHKKGTNVKSLRMLNCSTLNPLYNHFGLSLFCTLSVLDNISVFFSQSVRQSAFYRLQN